MTYLKEEDTEDNMLFALSLLCGQILLCDKFTYSIAQYKCNL